MSSRAARPTPPREIRALAAQRKRRIDRRASLQDAHFVVRPHPERGEAVESRRACSLGDTGTTVAHGHRERCAAARARLSSRHPLRRPLRSSPPGAPAFQRASVDRVSHDEGAQEIEKLVRVPRELLRDGDGWTREKLGPGVSAEATRWLYDRGVRVMGIDAWGWDRPLHLHAQDALRGQRRGIFWPPGGPALLADRAARQPRGPAGHRVHRRVLPAAHHRRERRSGAGRRAARLTG